MSTPKMRGLVELEELDNHFAALSHRTRRAVLLVLHANYGMMTSGSIRSDSIAPGKQRVAISEFPRKLA